VKVAYYSPMPPSHSGIADYSTLLLPALRERIGEIVLARPGKRAPLADVALYHVGNDPEAHGWIVDALRARPGVVVLHELVLHHLIAGITIGRGDGRAYLDAMERDFGVAGRLIGLGVLDNLLPLPWETRPDRFPLTGTILDLAQGLIVHSAYVERGVREAGYAGQIWRIPHPAWPDERFEPTEYTGEPLVGCFGHMNVNKRIPALLEAFAELRDRRPGARLLLVGEASERFELDRRLERLRLGGDELIREQWVSEERFRSLMAACDVLVNLRSPTMGETSGSVIRALALGKPVLVSDVGWFSELPDGAALKIPVDDHEVRTIAGALELAADHAAELGAAAAAYVHSEHDLGRVADAYTAALEEAAGGQVAQDAMLLTIAQAAAGIGFDDAAELARLTRESGLA
jgi:glycosyltransferase involved in cell wall biosynthesis